MSSLIFLVAVSYLFQAYLIILVARAILSWVHMFNPMWQPQNWLVVFLIRVIYGLTEPPLKILGKVIPPLNLGGVGIDLSFIVLFLAVMVLQRVVIQVLAAILL